MIEVLAKSSASMARATVSKKKGIENRKPMDVKRRTVHESHGERPMATVRRGETKKL